MPMKYLLDTNICIYIAKQKPQAILQKFEELAVGEIGMSIITYAELLHGAQKSQNSKKAYEVLEELADFIPPLPISINTGKHYALIRSQLEKIGKPIGNNDLWIAAHALDLEIILVTNNEKEFSRVESLKLENWVNL